MPEQKIAVIGDRESVLCFGSCGVDVFVPETKEQIEQQIAALAKENYAIILITEEKAERVYELTLEYKSRVYPIILPIPSAAGATGLGMRALKHNIEKAIGMDIVFNKEENN